jgi:uncharacterized protein YegL
MRRLPVYLLLDCSESMIGDSLAGVQAGAEMMLRSLRSDPHALETVWLSCITFDREAKLVFPLSELSDVQAPHLVARPGTALGAALNLCADRIEAEVKKTTPDQKGDWRPLVILLTDGQPTDSWKSALPRLGHKVRPRPANIYAVGCGDDVDAETLLELTDIVLHMREMTEERFRKLFVWLTASVNQGSRAVEEETSVFNLEKLPAEIKKVELGSLPQWDGRQKQVMLFAKCQKTRNPYLMRYRWVPEYSVYEAVNAHRLTSENSEVRDGASLPAVNSSELAGVPICPYCESKNAGRCASCGGLFCVDQDNRAKVACPHCANSLDLQEGGSFQVDQSLA